jgi:hypothetical protein
MLNGEVKFVTAGVEALLSIYGSFFMLIDWVRAFLFGEPVITPFLEPRSL